MVGEGEQTTKSLFSRVMDFQPCERTLKWEFGYWGGAISRWYGEGLPRSTDAADYKLGDIVNGPGLFSCGFGYEGKMSYVDQDVSRFFALDEGVNYTPYNIWIYPRMEKKIIFEDDTHIELWDGDGLCKKFFKDGSSTPHTLDWPVKTRNDWERIKEERFNEKTITARFVGDRKTFQDSINTSSINVLFDVPVGFFGSLRFLIGEERLFLLYYDDPEFVHDILSHLCDLWIKMAEELTTTIDFDVVCFWEDMAYKTGSLISPGLFKEFMSPQFKKLIGYLKSKGICHFNVDCDGNVMELVPLFSEAGVTQIYPLEQKASNDLLRLRKMNPKFGLIGGIDKTALFHDTEAIDVELEKVQYLISLGGFIPYIDHMIPPEVPFDNFKYYRESLNRIIDTTPVRI